DDGKGALNSFQDGLRATHHGDLPSHNTVLGHSYGTTLVGHAARDGSLNADDVIFVASPGVGVDHASDLHLNGIDQAQVNQHVHSTVAEDDIIHATNTPIYDRTGHNPIDPLGPDPAKPDFGGQVFESAPGTPGPMGGASTEAHSQYWEDRNPSLRKF